MFDSTLLNTKRHKRLPEDSGEWTPIPHEFRHLPVSVPQHDFATTRAIKGVATLLVVALHLFAYVSLDGTDLLVAIPFFAFAAPVVGILWVYQFRRMNVRQDLWHGLFWSLIGPLILAMATGLYWVAIVLVPVSLAFGLLGAFLAGNLLSSRSA